MFACCSSRGSGNWCSTQLSTPVPTGSMSTSHSDPVTRFTLTLPRTGLPGLAAESTEAPHRDTDRHKRAVYESARGTSKSLRILIADDHAVARAGLRELLSGRRELRVVGEAANGVEVISHCQDSTTTRGHSHGRCYA